VSVEGFLRAARGIVGDRHVLTDPGLTASYTVDWTGRWSGHTPAVIRPFDVGEVAELVGRARTEGVALVPQGGNTGLVGGSVPHRSEVVVSLRRLDTVEPVDGVSGQVTVGAGVTLARLQAEAEAAGWAFGVDLAARDAATVGGMVATNAGGLHVMRYGAMRAQLVGVEAVLGTGQVVARLTGLVKDNTGYDLAQLLCGSEGTLGLVTGARLRLVAPPTELVVAMVGLGSIDAAVEVAGRLRRTVAGLRAVELMAGDALRRVAGHLGAVPPTAPSAGAYLLVEVEGHDDPTERLAEALAGLADAAVATAGPDRRRLWQFRDAHTETAAAVAVERGGVVHKLDVTLPAGELAGFCSDVVDRIEGSWPKSVTMLYGHIGDGNIHVNVIGPPADDEQVDDLVLGLVVERGGSISAEHGIGVAKRRWLTRNRSASEVAAMRAIKHALDPDRILNPNVLLPPV
jgi:FAD/FMN-containing dehydrogenase